MMLPQIAPRVRTGPSRPPWAGGWTRNLRQRVMAAVNRPWGIAHLEDPTVANLLAQTAGIGGARLYARGLAVTQMINTRIAMR